jgi:hypothetical protein
MASSTRQLSAVRLRSVAGISGSLACGARCRPLSDFLSRGRKGRIGFVESLDLELAFIGRVAPHTDHDSAVQQW